MTIQDIYAGAVNLINQLIRKESSAQGHYLTGAMEDSLDSKQTHKRNEDTLEGFAIYYTRFVNEGVPAESASMRQFPFLVRYWQRRGLQGNQAKAAAAATIHKWMKEGMSTQASKRFSSTGARQNFVEAAFVGGAVQIDEYMTGSLDFAIDEKYLQEKSETI